MQESEALPPLAAPQSRPTISQRFRARWRKDLVFFSIALGVIVADQLTKAWVRNNLAYGEVGPSFGPVQIIHVVNSGAAFGILQGATPFLIVMSVFGLAAIVLYYVYPPMDHGLIRIALGMQLGGAIGNLLDRLRFGEVTDWIDVGEFPTFNIADACISTSIVIVLGFFVLQEFEERDRAKGKGQSTDSGQQTAEGGQQTTDSRQQTAESGQSASSGPYDAGSDN
jgi:signal peptidase II